MKILHVAQPVEGGVAAVALHLVTDQLARGWSVHLACPQSGELAQRARAAGVRVHPWHATRSPGPGSLGETFRLSRLLRQLAPDALHLHSSKAGLAGRVAARGRVPTVFQPHMWSFQAGGGLARLALRWERAAARWTDRLLCVSDDELAAGREAGVGGRAEVVANGIDVGQFAPGDRGEARAELGLGRGPIALCVGRLAEQKGQDLLLTAWARVLERVPGARLVLVGDGPMAARWREHHPLGSHPSVLWRGSCSPSAYYRAADVVVLASRAEGMALVPLEAMASGRSVVAFEVGGVRQSVGEAGAVVAPGDLDGLAGAVAERLSDPQLAAAEGRRGRDRATAHFDRRHSADRIARLLTDLVANAD
jgi:glycosyltransferase involved in cell wall biosynthesis